MACFEAVLADEYYEKIEIEQFWAASLTDAKSASKVLKSLRDCLPLAKSLQHVKRIRRVENDGHVPVLQVLLCSTTDLLDLPISDCKSLLESHNISCELFSEFSCVGVPAVAPLTMEQWTTGSRSWPCAFHEDKKVTKIREGRLFSSQELQYVTSCMRTAIDAAKHARTHGKPPIGAVLADPVQLKVLSVGLDSSTAPMHGGASHCHALKHAVMMCIDDLARQQGGGAWPENQCCDVLNTFRKSVSPSAQSSDSVRRSAAASYLCTGYDLFTTQEPCVMCSMALVHSRIGRVFYGTSSPSLGGLGTMFNIHCQPGVNHHFDVYRHVCQEQCQQLWTDT